MLLKFASRVTIELVSNSVKKFLHNNKRSVIVRWQGCKDVCMENMTHKTRRYLVDTLGLNIDLELWPESQKLPVYLQDSYEFQQTKLHNLPCLLMIALGEQGQTPAVIRKHAENIRVRWEGEVIYVRRNITAYNRKRLVQHKVSFIVPEKQLYLPLLGIDLREHFRRIRSEREQLSPSSQAVVINVLLDHNNHKYAPRELADKLGYSTMALTRVFDELEFAKIATTSRQGRKRFIEFPVDKRHLWEMAGKFLSDPVKKRVYVNEMSSQIPNVVAGLTALSRMSMLSAPARMTYAISSKAWKAIKGEDGLEQLPSIETNAIELEIWHYNPVTFATNGSVDSFSLYQSLKDSNDERIQIALEEMMEKIEW
jgi:hypothetical protein